VGWAGGVWGWFTGQGLDAVSGAAEHVGELGGLHVGAALEVQHEATERGKLDAQADNATLREGRQGEGAEARVRRELRQGAGDRERDGRAPRELVLAQRRVVSELRVWVLDRPRPGCCAPFGGFLRSPRTHPGPWCTTPEEFAVWVLASDLLIGIFIVGPFVVDLGTW